MNDLSDLQLLALVRHGNMDAYGELYARHSHGALKLARYLRCGQYAEDVVSTAFTAVLGAIQNGGGPTSDDGFWPYLYTAVKTNAGHVQKVNARAIPLEEMPAMSVPFASRDEREHVEAALAQLMPRHRRLLWRLYVEQYRPREVAELENETADVIRAAGFRARALFRTAYDGPIEETENSNV